MSDSRFSPKAKISKEPVLAQAVDVARNALEQDAHIEHIGEHAGLVQEADRVVTHAFECLMPGYRGWFWTVTLARASRSKHITVNEISLRPGPDALLAPEWVPWSDRLRPGDVSPSDRLPYNPNDPNLDAVDPDLKEGYEATDSDADVAAQWELGLGRARVLSESGRAQAFRRWYRSDSGPHNQATRDAKAQCSTCGYFMKMAGSARHVFGVCANEWSAFDGRVVSADHGCGAHSETDVTRRDRLWVQSEPVLDEADMEVKPRSDQR